MNTTILRYFPIEPWGLSSWHLPELTPDQQLEADMKREIERGEVIRKLRYGR
jgi:hypothetical protein